MEMDCPLEATKFVVPFKKKMYVNVLETFQRHKL